MNVQANQAQQLPPYCEHFPALEGKLNQANGSGNSSNNNDVAYTLCHGQRTISIQVDEIMENWVDVQKAQNEERVKQFEEKMRKKVFEAVAASIYPYNDLYDKQNCRELESFGRDGAQKRERCESKQDFLPKCNNPEYQEILESKAQDYEIVREDEAREALAAEGFQEFPSEQVEHQALSDAHDYLDEQKKLNFLKSHVQNTLLIDKLLKLREIEKNRFKEELSKSLETCRDICQKSWGPGQNGAQRCSRCREKTTAQVKKNHEKQMTPIQTSLGQIYEKNPSLFEVENDLNFSLSNLVSSRYEKSDFAKELEQKVLDETPRLEKMSFEDTVDFISSVSGQSALARAAGNAMKDESSDIEMLGREKVFQEKRNKIKALEKLCQGDIGGLHHFPGIAESVIKESMNSSRRSKKNLVQDQAAYCHLLQTRPPGQEGGLSVGAILGATALIAGGTVVQFIPVLGQMAGAGAIGLGAAVLGGGAMVYDGIDKYNTSLSQYESTQAAYHGSTAWADSSQLLESKDQMTTKRALAAAEVGLVAADGVLLIRPALTLAKRFAPRGSKIPEVKTPTAPYSETPTQAPREITQRQTREMELTDDIRYNEFRLAYQRGEYDESNKYISFLSSEGERVPGKIIRQDGDIISVQRTDGSTVELPRENLEDVRLSETARNFFSGPELVDQTPSAAPRAAPREGISPGPSPNLQVNPNAKGQVAGLNGNDIPDIQPRPRAAENQTSAIASTPTRPATPSRPATNPELPTDEKTLYKKMAKKLRDDGDVSNRSSTMLEQGNRQKLDADLIRRHQEVSGNSRLPDSFNELQLKSQKLETALRNNNQKQTSESQQALTRAMSEYTEGVKKVEADLTTVRNDRTVAAQNIEPDAPAPRTQPRDPQLNQDKAKIKVKANDGSVSEVDVEIVERPGEGLYTIKVPVGRGGQKTYRVNRSDLKFEVNKDGQTEHMTMAQFDAEGTGRRVLEPDALNIGDALQSNEFEKLENLVEARRNIDHPPVNQGDEMNPLAIMRRELSADEKKYLDELKELVSRGENSRAKEDVDLIERAKTILSNDEGKRYVQALRAKRREDKARQQLKEEGYILLKDRRRVHQSGGRSYTSSGPMAKHTKHDDFPYLLNQLNVNMNKERAINILERWRDNPDVADLHHDVSKLIKQMRSNLESRKSTQLSGEAREQMREKIEYMENLYFIHRLPHDMDAHIGDLQEIEQLDLRSFWR